MDSWISGLIEGQNPDSESRVLPDQLQRLLVRVERVHQDQGDVDVVFLVQPLNLEQQQDICQQLNRRNCVLAIIIIF